MIKQTKKLIVHEGLIIICLLLMPCLTHAESDIPKNMEVAQWEGIYKDANYYAAVGGLVQLTKYFNDLAKENGGFGYIYGIKSKIKSVLGISLASTGFETQLLFTSNRLARMAWPMSTSVGGSIAKDQYDNFRTLMPSWFDTRDSYYRRLGHCLQLAFQNKSLEVYERLYYSKDVDEENPLAFINDKWKTEAFRKYEATFVINTLNEIIAKAGVSERR